MKTIDIEEYKFRLKLAEFGMQMIMEGVNSEGDRTYYLTIAKRGIILGEGFTLKQKQEMLALSIKNRI